MVERGFSSPTVSAIAGVPRSTLNYWAGTGVVTPSLRGPAGKRATHWWSLSDLIAVRSVKALREAGCPLQTLRRVQPVVEGSWKERLGHAVLQWDGVDLLRVGRFGEVESLIRHPGQGVLHVVALPIGRWQEVLAEHAEAVDIDRLRANDERRASRTRTTWRAATG